MLKLIQIVNDSIEFQRFTVSYIIQKDCMLFHGCQRCYRVSMICINITYVFETHWNSICAVVKTKCELV